jgi:hypothetical protein
MWKEGTRGNHETSGRYGQSLIRDLNTRPLDKQFVLLPTIPSDSSKILNMESCYTGLPLTFSVIYSERRRGNYPPSTLKTEDVDMVIG